MKAKLWTLLVIVTIAMLGISIAPGRAAAQSEQPFCVIYQADGQGFVGDYTGGYEFSIDDMILVVYPFSIGGNSNKVELWLQHGNPLTYPSRGALVYMSNTAFLSSSSTFANAAMSLGSISYEVLDDNTIYLHVAVTEDFALAQGGMFNLFNLNNGVTAGAKLVTGGYIDFYFYPDGTMEAEINLNGRDWTTLPSPYNSNLVYQAYVSGVLVNDYSTACAIAS